MDNKKSEIFTENDINFNQKPYSENFPYNMVKMAAIEPICFYPNRDHVKDFNNRKLNMNKLTDFIYQENKKKNEIEKDDILSKLKQPYYRPEYYNSSFVNRTPIIDVLPAKCIHETTNQYKQYEKIHYEVPAWTQAEKDLFNLLYNTIGKNFHKIAKEFESKATTIVIPPTILKQCKVNITKESNKNIVASITTSNTRNKDISDIKIKKRKIDDKDTQKSKKSKTIETKDTINFHCQALPDLANNSFHLLVHNINNPLNDMSRDDMIFPRKTSEIIHFYYKNKFSLPNWKSHKTFKIAQKKEKLKQQQQQKQQEIKK